jgi:hypothetical protein
MMMFIRLYYWDKPIKKELGWARGTHGKSRKTCTVLVCKLEGKRHTEKTRFRSKDNIKIYFKDIGVEGAWSGLVWPAPMNAAMNLRFS